VCDYRNYYCNRRCNFAGECVANCRAHLKYSWGKCSDKGLNNSPELLVFFFVHTALRVFEFLARR